MDDKQLPDGLRDEFRNMQRGVKQWSQFVAWSWSNHLAYKGDQKKEEEEQELKEFFIKILQDQARYRYAVSSYGDKDAKPLAYATSLKIKKLLIGKNSDIDECISQKIDLTLPDVYGKLTKKEKDSEKEENTKKPKKPDSLSHEPFMQMFHVEIVTDSFSGRVRDMLLSEKKELKKIIEKYSKDDLKYVEPVEYVIYLAYPPCPAFGKATVTEDQLKNWMQGKNEDGEGTTDYLPPSAYIPVSFT
ncbi:hypothetical protein IQ264_27780 [Phormidium sp. LEGE 05292]|uniref:hypothetical protein n=1 Tax=[Phormidium] sp. LEGE 05292 TaxID=767427 RepID=UPI0018803BA2|nr:hypothetical protein [Phormidium sp. LEGE 05292]MBE9229209.1 hypothetical protein [Phormidium sp. LEGE 05292]